MGQLVHFDPAEAGTGKVVTGALPSPHGAQTLATLRQGHTHAMHNRDGIKQWSHGMFTVMTVVA